VPASIRNGDCVKIPDGRVARVRGKSSGYPRYRDVPIAVPRDAKYKVRVRRRTGATHQFLVLSAAQLRRVDCPPGWMSPAGYNRYLKTTLAKMRQRLAGGHSGKRRNS